MNDAGRVRSGEGIRDLDGVLREVVKPHSVAGNQLLHRLADHALHGDEQAPVRLTDVVNGHNIGMVEGRSSLRLPFEALAALRVLHHVGREDLERHGPVQARVECPIDDTHSAFAELLDDAVVRNHRFGHERISSKEPEA